MSVGQNPSRGKPAQERATLTKKKKKKESKHVSDVARGSGFTGMNLLHGAVMFFNTNRFLD